MRISNFYHHNPQSGAVKNLVIMLHGVGSNGQDLISLAPILSQMVPDTAFVSPDAPFPCDMVPPGYPNAYQWFSLQDRDPKVLLDGVKAVSPLVETFIEEQRQDYGLGYDRLALFGFSQGTMTSLHVAPRLKQKIAGVLGYSGALLWDAASDAADLQKMPIHLIHGQADDVVPVEARAQAQTVLEQNGFPVSGHISPGLTHSIDQDGVDSGAAFLNKVFR